MTMDGRCPVQPGSFATASVIVLGIGAAHAAFPAPAVERLLGTTPVGENLAVPSDQAPYFFDGRDVVAGETLLKPRLRMPIPGGPGGLHSLELIELVGGYLVSNAFTHDDYTMADAAPLRRDPDQGAG